MAAVQPTLPQALGSEPEGDVRQCMFCGDALANRGPAFMDHVAAKPQCREAYEAWLERLDEDRPGG
jgi:hypothetical protein